MSAELVNPDNGPVVPNQSKYNDPLMMALAKSALGMTETEVYIAEGGVPEELLTARSLDPERPETERSVPPETSQKGPRSSETTTPFPQEGGEVPTSQLIPDVANKTFLEIDVLINELEQIKTQASDKEKIRWDAWQLKIQGYSIDLIAQQLGKSTQTIYLYFEWCMRQLPHVKEQLEEFTRVTVLRLEAQYRQLAIARFKGDIMAHKVSLDILDQQGKLLGVHKMSVEIDNRVTYELVGVDMDKL